MSSARAGFQPMIPICRWWSRRISAGCPDRSFTTNPWRPLRKRFGFDTGSTRSIPPTPITGADGLRLSFKKTECSWAGIGSGPRCARWGSKGFIPGQILVNGLWPTRFIPIFSGESLPGILTMSGGSTSPISDFPEDGFIWLRSSTGSADMWWLGNSTRRSKCRLSWNAWSGPSKRLLPPSSTAIREAILPVILTWTCSVAGISRSQWMAKDGQQTTSLPNASGEASNGKRSISTNMTPPVRLENESEPGSSSITTRDLINPWNTELLGKSFRRGQRTRRKPCKASLKPRRNYSSNKNFLCLKIERFLS